jgi:arabinose-5-phosphate isomerase
MNEDIREILKHEAEAVLNIPVSDNYYKAIDLIIEQVHKKHGKLVTSGMGKAGQIALNMSTTFSSTGTPSVFLHPSEAQHGDLGIIQENDIMLLISNSGKTREIVELIPLARRLRPGIKFIVITGNENSVLAEDADVCLPTGNPKVMTVIGDVLVVGIMKKIGFSNEEYAKRHHGGYLGEKSRQQSEK